MSNFIQRIHVTIEAGNDEEHLMVMTPMHGGDPITVDIAPTKHYRDERAIAAALRRYAKLIETGGCYFQGQVK